MPLAKPEHRPGTRLHPLDKPGYDNGWWHVPTAGGFGALLRSLKRTHEDDWRWWRREQAKKELRRWARNAPFGSADHLKESPDAYRYYRGGTLDEIKYVVSCLRGTEHEEEYAEEKRRLKKRWGLPDWEHIGPAVEAERS